MVKDPKQSAKIGLDWSILAEEGSPVGIIRVRRTATLQLTGVGGHCSRAGLEHPVRAAADAMDMTLQPAAASLFVCRLTSAPSTRLTSLTAPRTT